MTNKTKANPRFEHLYVEPYEPEEQSPLVEKLTSVRAADTDWIVDNLYRCQLHGARASISHLVYRLSVIERWVHGPNSSLTLILTPVLDVWSASILADDARTITTQPEQGWIPVDIVTLGSARLRIEFLIEEERKRYGSFVLTPGP